MVSQAVEERVSGAWSEVGAVEWKARHRGGPWVRAFSRLLRDPVAVTGAATLIFMIVAAIGAPLLTPFHPTDVNAADALQPPSRAHILGTDDLGRDVFSRLLYGGRESLRVGLLATLTGLACGGALGLIAGYYGGAVDSTIARMMDVMLALPSLLLIIAIVSALGTGLTTVLIGVGISFIPTFARVVRGSMLSAREEDYVLAAKSIGSSNLRIMTSHLLPNVVAPAVVLATMSLGNTILWTAGLSYIGLGAQPPSPEWGAMLFQARSYIRTAAWLSAFPGLAIFIAVLSVNLLGDGLRDALDPTMRVR